MPTLTGTTVLGESNLGGILNSPPSSVIFAFGAPFVPTLNLRKVGTLYYVTAVGGGLSAIAYQRDIKYPGLYELVSIPNSGQVQFFIFECSRPGLPYLFAF